VTVLRLVTVCAIPLVPEIARSLESLTGPRSRRRPAARPVLRPLARSWRPAARPLRSPGVAVAVPRRVRARPRFLRLVEPLGPWAARGSGTLLSGRGRAGTGPGRARARAANTGHRVLWALPGPVLGCLVVAGLPAAARRVAGAWLVSWPGRGRALLAGARRPWRVGRPGPVAVPAAGKRLVPGVDGVSVRFQVGVLLVGVVISVGGVIGPAKRASARSAALTTHPAPPGRRSSPTN